MNNLSGKVPIGGGPLGVYLGGIILIIQYNGAIRDILRPIIKFKCGKDKYVE